MSIETLTLLVNHAANVVTRTWHHAAAVLDSHQILVTANCIFTNELPACTKSDPADYIYIGACGLCIFMQMNAKSTA